MSETPWEDKFNALPPWAKKLVRGVDGLLVHGSNNGSEATYPIFDPPRNNAFHFHASFKRGADTQWSSGFRDMLMFAKHLDAERKVIAKADPTNAGRVTE